MSATYSGIDGYVGNTPLIRLRRLSELTGCEILGKAEFMNPGGSVKDRAAYGIITDAEKAGRLKPGATIVEGTAGNTGIGLAVIGRARGYRTVIVIPNNQSPEKMHLLRTLGAEVKAVPEKPYKDPENYNHIARRLAEERGWFWANQFDNTANRDAHYRSTGPEIWKQTEGKISAFVAAVGTGGTLAGVSTYLKEQNPKIEICLRGSVWRSDVVVVHEWQSGNERRRFDCGRNRSGPCHKEHRRCKGRSRLSHS